MSARGSKARVQESRQPGVAVGQEDFLWMSSVIVTALQSAWLPSTLEVSSRLIKSLSVDGSGVGSWS